MIDETNQKTNIKDKSSISMNFKKGGIADFVRFYKAFIYFSINLWIKPVQEGLPPVVSFHQYIEVYSFYKIYEQEEIRSIKLYLMLEGIYLILSNKNVVVLRYLGFTTSRK